MTSSDYYRASLWLEAGTKRSNDSKLDDLAVTSPLRSIRGYIRINRLVRDDFIQSVAVRNLDSVFVTVIGITPAAVVRHRQLPS